MPRLKCHTECKGEARAQLYNDGTCEGLKRQIEGMTMIVPYAFMDNNKMKMCTATKFQTAFHAYKTVSCRAHCLIKA